MNHGGGNGGQREAASLGCQRIGLQRLERQARILARLDARIGDRCHRKPPTPLAVELEQGIDDRFERQHQPAGLIYQ
jgi:hypothetical protein